MAGGRLAPLCVAAAFFAGCSASDAASSAKVQVFHCAAGRTLVVHQAADVALVDYEGRQFELARRPSALAEKYSSGEATLFIDREFAAFVAESIIDVQGCRSWGEARS